MADKKQIDNGGSAFPLTVNATENSGEDFGVIESPGMSLLDHFASHAPADLMRDLIPNESVDPPPQVTHDFEGAKLEAFKGWGDYLDDKDINPVWLADFKAFAAKLEARSKIIAQTNVDHRLKQDAEMRYRYARAMLTARSPDSAKGRVGK